MATIRSWSGVGLSPGALTTSSAGTGDTAFSSITGTALTVDASGPRSPQIKVADGTGTSYATWTVGPLTNWAIRFYVTKSSSAAFVFQVNDGATDKAAGFDFNTGGSLRLSARQGGTNVNLWVATAAFPVDTRMRVEYTETSAGAWTVAYYTGDSTTAVQTGSGTKTTPQSAVTVWAGRISGAVATTNLFLDDLAVGDNASALGPWTDGTTPPSWFRYNGTAWVGMQMVRL